MFGRISVLLALQFTAFVALLLLINGLLFIGSDQRFSRQLQDQRLLQTSNRIITRLQSSPLQMSISLLPFERDMVRIVDSRGNTIYAGMLFNELPFDPRVSEFSEITIDRDHIRVMTTPILRLGVLEGFLQVGRFVEPTHQVLWRRGILLMLTTAGISILTFFIGLFFARRSLKPAEAAMQRLEQFTQDASHELRTPLAVLGSSLDLALKTKKYEEGILSAKDDLKRITSLAERLLELARLDTLALKPERVDLSMLTESVVRALEPAAAAKKIKLSHEISAGIVADADATLVRQMVENLVGNAIKFTPAEGSVQVTLKGSELRVHDTGVGIPTTQRERIFDRFYQADSAHASGGFGLGLALVKRIADLHGWTIAVRGSEGKGTTFIVKIAS
jgi:signal transduction histidine kinase